MSNMSNMRVGDRVKLERGATIANLSDGSIRLRTVSELADDPRVDFRIVSAYDGVAIVRNKASGACVAIKMVNLSHRGHTVTLENGKKVELSAVTCAETNCVHNDLGHAPYRCNLKHLRIAASGKCELYKPFEEVK